MTKHELAIRPATTDDLEAINQVVESAMMTWNLTERVKRLSLSSYQYSEIDFGHLEFVVAIESQKNIIGVASWEIADTRDAPAGYTALLLHGIYVVPKYHRQGIGRQLFISAEQAAINHGYDGILVKAQEDAIDFFTSQGMKRLAPDNPALQYANRFWKNIKGK